MKLHVTMKTDGNFVRWDIVDSDGTIYSVPAAREMYLNNLVDDVTIETNDAFDKLVELHFDAIEFDNWVNAR
jgi:hypothetical protein